MALQAAKKAVQKSEGGCNWLGAYIEAIRVVCPFESSDHVFQEDVKQFSDVITLRNCVMHSWGNVEQSEYAERTKAVVVRIEVMAKEKNEELVSISSDGYLEFGDNMVAHALCLVEPIVDFICKAMIANLEPAE